MSSVKVDGFKVRTPSSICLIPIANTVDRIMTYGLRRLQSSDILAALATVFDSYSDEEKKSQIKKVPFLHSIMSYGWLTLKIVSPIID